MKGHGTALRMVRLFIPFIAVAVCAAFLFLLCYYTDNKYTAKGPRPIQGVLALSEQNLVEYPLIYLVTGWEIYRGRLLAPEDFTLHAAVPDEHVFIGQYGGLEGRVGSGRGPHGSATYRLQIRLPSEITSYTLELPEIYSAYKLYINGVLMAQIGEPEKESYRAETGNSKITLRCADHMEILIAVSDYSHFYSGMVYPPAFGHSAQVEAMLNTRLGLRFAAVALALGVGLLYLGVWLLQKKNEGKTDLLPLFYAGLCFCFALYICYPAVKTLWTSGMGWYAIESLAYPAMLLMVTQIQSRVVGVSNLFMRLMAALGTFTCGWAGIVPLIPGGSLRLMLAHSVVLNAYTWAVAFYLLASSVYGAYQNAAHSKTMLAGAAIFGTALVMDRLLPLFEPICIGWFSEISGGCHVLLIGAVMAGEIAGQFRLRLQLEGRVESVRRMMEVQKACYPEILEKEEALRAARHDFRHHLAVIGQLAAAGDLAKLLAYAQSVDGRAGFHPQVSYCKHYVTDMLLRMYVGLAEKQNTGFSVEADLPDTLPIEDVDICVILSNLLENALEASRGIPEESRFIFVRIRCNVGSLSISIDNVFDGIFKLQGGRFLSKKQKGREGVGLASVQAVSLGYGGNAEFYVRKGTVFHSEIVLPLITKPMPPYYR